MNIAWRGIHWSRAKKEQSSGPTADADHGGITWFLAVLLLMSAADFSLSIPKAEKTFNWEASNDSSRALVIDSQQIGNPSH
jgi:hypothetical protein